MSAPRRSERGLRGVVGVLAVGAQDAEQTAHLGQRLAAGGLDRSQRADRGVGSAVEHAARPPACTTMIEIECATTSCISRAIRPPLLRHRLAPALGFALALGQPDAAASCSSAASRVRQPALRPRDEERERGDSRVG